VKIKYNFLITTRPWIAFILPILLGFTLPVLDFFFKIPQLLLKLSMPLGLMLIVLWCLSVGTNISNKFSKFKSAEKKLLIFFAISTLLLLFVFPGCIFYDIKFILINLSFGALVYLSSKIITRAENQLNDVAQSQMNTFLMIWVFPIGIWYLQPKIQRLLLDKKHKNLGSHLE